MKRIGIAFGVFDIFHIGHLNYLKKVSLLCDYLYVGIRGDDIVTPGKGRGVFFSENIRCQVISELNCVNKAFVFDKSLDETTYWLEWFKINKIDFIFVGEDWKNSQRWNRYESLLKNCKLKIIYIQRTENISSTMILEYLKKENI